MRFFNPVVDRTHEGEELVFRQTGVSMFQLFLRIFPLVNYRPVTLSGKISIFFAPPPLTNSEK